MTGPQASRSWTSTQTWSLSPVIISASLQRRRVLLANLIGDGALEEIDHIMPTAPRVQAVVAGQHRCLGDASFIDQQGLDVAIAVETPTEDLLELPL